MAGYLHRMEAASRTNGNGKATLYNPNTPAQTPLQNFVKAKEKINGIFKDIQKYVDDVADFLSGLAESQTLVSQEVVASSCRFKESVSTIREVLSRDHMKVVFFGRTSNGKSSVINAMLHSKVLPSGIGHTTRCFVQVEGSSSGAKHIYSEDSPTEKNIDSLDQLANSLCSKEMGEDTLVRISWPKVDSKLLQNEVVLVDSPGIDVSPQFDSWIDKHCLDADVFVLVSNAESTLTQTEKNFFYRVNTKLSKPNVFILNNRWDASANEPEFVDQVRAQHMSRFLDFLVNELQVCTVEEAKHRIFFVSAREMLSSRLRDKGFHSPSVTMADGYQARMLEFEDFERQFELCISHSAINTKFEMHVEKGRAITASLHEVLENVNNSINDSRLKASESHLEKSTQLQKSQSGLLKIMSDARDKMQQLSSEVQLKVSTDIAEEIRRLEPIIEAFPEHFSDEKEALAFYRKKLTVYVEDAINSDLTVRCTQGLFDRIITLQKELIVKILDILPPENQVNIYKQFQYRDPFRFSFAFNCHVLLEDFHEDLEFRFSFGLYNIIRRLAQLRAGSGKSTTHREESSFGTSFIPRPMSGIDTPPATASGSRSEEVIMNSLMLSGVSFAANSGVGVLIVGGLVSGIYKTIGWKILAGCASIYGLLYLLERYNWNSSTKEKQYKRQYRRYLCKQIRKMANSVTMSCDSQANREMQEVLSRLQKVANESHGEMRVEVERLHKEVQELERLRLELAQTKGKATFLSSELDTFRESFLKRVAQR